MDNGIFVIILLTLHFKREIDQYGEREGEPLAYNHF